MQSRRRLCRPNPGSAADPVAGRAPAAPAPQVLCQGTRPNDHEPGAGARLCSTRRPLSSPVLVARAAEGVQAQVAGKVCAPLPSRPGGPGGQHGRRRVPGGRPPAHRPRERSRGASGPRLAGCTRGDERRRSGPGRTSRARGETPRLREPPSSPEAPRPGPLLSSPPPQTQPEASTYRSRSGRGGSARRAPAARALCYKRAWGRKAGRGRGAPPADSPHTPLPTLFPFYCYRKNNRSSRRLVCSPALRPLPRTPAPSAAGAASPQVPLEMLLAPLQNKFSFIQGKQPNKDPRSPQPPPPGFPHSHTQRTSAMAGEDPGVPGCEGAAQAAASTAL